MENPFSELPIHHLLLKGDFHLLKNEKRLLRIWRIST